MSLYSREKNQQLFGRLTDKVIIEGVRQQDEKILCWLYDNYLQQVRHYVLKNSGSDDDVSDVFQESIITLYNQISENKLTLSTDLKGYFFGIAKNIWNSMLRKKPSNEELDNEIADTDDSSEEIANQLLEKIIFRCLRKLKPDAQTIMTLYSEGCSYEEIAFKMDLKNEAYARRKKYLSKEALIEIIKADPEYKDYLDLR